MSLETTQVIPSHEIPCASAAPAKAFERASIEAVNAITDAEFLIDFPVTFSNETSDERVLVLWVFDMLMGSKELVKTHGFHS
jgi:DNA polymerase II small subunit/DNA polymerase delta subunit B